MMRDAIRHFVAVGVLASGMVCFSTPCYGDVDDDLQRIASQRGRIDDMSSSILRQREQATLVEMYTSIAHDHIDDHRAASWFMDAATVHLIERFDGRRDALGALYGLHKAGASEPWLDDVSTEPSRLLDLAEKTLAGAIDALERNAAFGQDVALQDRHRKLVEELRERRLPYLRGVNLALRSQSLRSLDGWQRDEAARKAVTLLQPLDTKLGGRSLTTARFYLGVGLVRTGEAQRASKIFQNLVDDEDLVEWDRRRAQCGLIDALTRIGQHDEAIALLDDLNKYARTLKDKTRRHHLGLLVCDMRMRTRQAQRAPLSFDSYVAMLTGDFPGWLPHDVMRHLALAGRVYKPAIGDEQEYPWVELATAFDQSGNKTTAASARQAIIELQERIALSSVQTLFAIEGHGQSFVTEDRLREAAEVLLRVANLNVDASDEPNSMKQASLLRSAMMHAWEASNQGDAAARRLLVQIVELCATQFILETDVSRTRMLAAQLAIQDERWVSALKFARMIDPVHNFAWISYGLQASALAGQWKVDADLATASGVLEQLAALRAKTDHQKTLNGIDLDRADIMVRRGDAASAARLLASLQMEDLRDQEHATQLLAIRLQIAEATGDLAGVLDDVSSLVERDNDRAVQMLSRVVNNLSAELEASWFAGTLDVGRARDLLLPLAKKLEWIQYESGSATTLVIADAARLGGQREEAERLYVEVLEEHPTWWQAQRGLAECLVKTNDEKNLARAMGIYKSFVRAREIVGDDTWWLAQLRQFEILKLMQRQTDQIGPAIERLLLGDTTSCPAMVMQRLRALRTQLP